MTMNEELDAKLEKMKVDFELTKEDAIAVKVVVDLIAGVMTETRDALEARLKEIGATKNAIEIQVCAIFFILDCAKDQMKKQRKAHEQHGTKP